MRRWENERGADIERSKLRGNLRRKANGSGYEKRCQLLSLYRRDERKDCDSPLRLGYDRSILLKIDDKSTEVVSGDRRGIRDN